MKKIVLVVMALLFYTGSFAQQIEVKIGQPPVHVRPHHKHTHYWMIHHGYYLQNGHYVRHDNRSNEHKAEHHDNRSNEHKEEHHDNKPNDNGKGHHDNGQGKGGKHR